MEKQLSISKTKALQEYEAASPEMKLYLEGIFGKEAFEKDIFERIQNFKDVLDKNGIDEDEFVKSLTGLSEDEVAYRQIKEIVKAYNGTWTPDWDNEDEYKYVPWFDMRKSAGSGFAFGVYVDWYTVTVVGSRLCFKESAFAKDAAQKFIEIYKQFFTINTK